ncbi:MAG: rRNA maturation RNase YbeY, partial [Pseudomonadota bacterium]
AFLIDDPEMQTLNRNWRGKDKATNVLAFATDAPVFEPNLPYPAGDVMLSYTTIAKEAKGFGLPFHHHLIHMVVHGVLHLMGFDHIHDDEAIRMEQHEQIILAAIKSQIASDISSPERTINRMQANA